MDINKKVLNEVSKGAKMGMDAIKFVSDKVSDSRFQRVLNVEYLKYKEIFNRVGNIYHNYDLTDDPQETNIMNKAMTWYGIQMNTMTDKSNSNISELLLQGTNMGIIEGRRLLNNNPSVDKNVRQILDDFVVSKISREFVTASDFINYVLSYENISLIKVGKNLLDNIITSYELLSLDDLDLSNKSFVTFLDDFLNPNKYLFR